MKINELKRRIAILQRAALAAAPIAPAAVVMVGEIITDADRATASRDHPGKRIIFVKVVDSRRTQLESEPNT